MSRKHVKQYLMLLLAIGVIAVALSGGGTFASFNAETANPGNTFATGTLYLHDSVNGSATECTSESASNNSNVPASVGGANPGNACDILFTVPTSQFATNGLVNTAPAFSTDGTDSTTTGITATTYTNGSPLTLTIGGGGLTHSIPNGAIVQLSDGVNTDTMTATADFAAAATTITLAGTLAHAYDGTVNAINVQTLYITSISVEGWDGNTSPNVGLMFGVASGSEVQITDGTNSDICSASGSASAAATSISLNGCTLLHTYSTGDYVQTPGPFIAHLTLRNAGTIDGSDLKFQLNGTSTTACQVTAGPSGATTLCNDLGFSVTETDSSFAGTIDYTTGDVSGAEGCAYGTLGTNGCNADTTNFNLGGLAYRSGLGNGFDNLGLSSGGGTNNSRDLTGVDSTVNHPTGSGYSGAPVNSGLSGGARYFLVEIWPGDLVNNDMGASTTFDLVWHMDQA